MGNKIVIIITLFFVWLLLTWDVSAPNVVIGLAVSIFIAAVFKETWTKTPRKFLQWKRFAGFAHLLVIFTWEVIKANLDMAYRVLHPKMPIAPGILKIRTNCSTEVSITLLSNVITLTPGTFTVDADLKNGFLYVHWINVKVRNPEDAYRKIVFKFEKIIKEVFE